MPKRIVTETAHQSPATAVTEGKGKRYRVRLIEGPRWGSSGYYTTEALNSAPAAFQGCKAYLDHPTATETTDRPERSLRDLVGHYEHLTREADGVWGELVPRPHMAELVESLASNGDLDVSIRASAEATAGEVNGRAGIIVNRFLEGRSVDLVTEAGAGGRVYELIESARAATPGPVVETLASDLENQVRAAVRAAHSDPDRDRYAWVRDVDPDEQAVYIDLDGKTWRQAFTRLDVASVALTGDRTEVRPVTTYHSVTSAEQVGESSPITTTPKEKHMEITEAKLAELTAAADRVTALEAERNTAIQRAEAAEADARTVARDAYNTQVGAALQASTLPDLAQARVKESLALAEGADVPTDAAVAIEAAIKAEADYLTQVAPTRRPLGFGAAVTESTRSRTRSAWGTPLTKEA